MIIPVKGAGHAIVVGPWLLVVNIQVTILELMNQLLQLIVDCHVF
jgi:hypothetical protein